MSFKGSQGSAQTGDRRFTDGQQSVDSVIGREARVEGTIKGTTNVDINGEFEGEIQVRGLVWLRPGSKVKGEIRATDLVIEGKAAGQFKVGNKLDLRATARVEGDLQAATIAMADGSVFEGAISMTGEKKDVVRYEEKRQAVEGPEDEQEGDCEL